MQQSIRAVYEKGQLRLLDPVKLAEGQVVNINIVGDDATPPTPDEVDRRLRAAGLLLEIEIPDDAEELTPEERQRIGALFVGDRPSEELISEDRGEY